MSACLHLLHVDRVWWGDVRPSIPSRLWHFQCETDMMPDRTLSGRVRQAYIWWYACVSVLFGGYDCSPSTQALHADIHCHIFLEIKVNQQDKDIGIAAYYLDVRVITCFRRNSNEVMYDDDIDFFVVCFQTRPISHTHKRPGSPINTVRHRSNMTFPPEW